MTAIMNGIALHGGLIPYGGTFLVFSDYARNAVRMAALMKQGVILVYTHDSIGLGEDGPTHQPIEHLCEPAHHSRTCASGVPATPSRPPSHGATRSRGATVRRAWCSRGRRCPRRSGTTRSSRRSRAAATCSSNRDGAPECVLIATGSEVGLALDAAREMAARGRRVRVVSMPCTSLFDAEPQSYRDSVLPPGVPRVAIEAGAREGWWRYVGSRRRGDRHDGFRRLGAREATLRAFRFHPRPRDQYGRGSIDAPVNRAARHTSRKAT